MLGPFDRLKDTKALLFRYTIFNIFIMALSEVKAKEEETETGRQWKMAQPLWTQRSDQRSRIWQPEVSRAWEALSERKTGRRMTKRGGRSNRALEKSNYLPCLENGEEAGPAQA